MDWLRLAGGTHTVISVDLQDHVREPHGALTRWVTHTGQILTEGERRRDTQEKNMVHVRKRDRERDRETER